MVSIAIIGTSGTLGKYVLDAFQQEPFASKVDFPIKALTTKDKSSETTDKVQYIQGDATKDDLAEKFQGTDVIINLVHADASILKGIEKLVLAVKPKAYFPSEFGSDTDILEGDELHPIFVNKIQHAKVVSDAGIKVVKILTGFFRIPPIFLYVATNHIGIDQTNKVITKVSGGNETIPFSTGEDIGKSVASISTSDLTKLKDSYKILSGKKPRSEVIEELQKSHGEFTVKEISLDELKQQNAENFKSENPDFTTTLHYLLATGKALNLDGDDDELVNPGQSLWKWQTW